MFWALDESGSLVQASPRVKATCPVCGAAVRSKTGNLVTWHFAHHARWRDCDTWGENEGYWHYMWKTKVPQHMREVVIRRPMLEDGQAVEVVHRADIVNGRGEVIELQHSKLSESQIKEREHFYGSMIWLFDFTDSDSDRVVPEGRHTFKSTRKDSLYSRFKFKRRREGDRDEYEFEWRRAYRWMLGINRPLFIDFGRKDSIFHMVKFSFTQPCHGWGRFYSKADFLKRFFV